jgi:peptidyl-dipeptidase Dcp
MTNPLIASQDDTAFGLPPFESIEDAHFAPAFEEAFSAARAEIEAICVQPEAPDFSNTIGALESAASLLDHVAALFFHLAATDANPTREALMREVSPKLAKFSSEITMNATLFDRIEALWEGRAALGLSDEEFRVLTLTRQRFVRAGARLEGAARDRYAQIMQRLAELGTAFTQNLLGDERDWFMPLDTQAQEGLPDFLLDAARAAGEEKQAPGPVVTLSRSLVTPFLQFSPHRSLRKRAYEAYVARGANGGETDNRAIAAETLRLREERAQLLGYDSFAQFKLETEMAKTPERVRELLMAVWDPARNAAERDAAELAQMLHGDGYEGPLEPWDWHYYSERRRHALHELDEAQIKPYLQLERMIEAAFDTAHKLFGLSFAPLQIALPHEDARAWEVTRDGKHMAVFIADFFARGSKRSGAWCSTMRRQHKQGKETRAIVTNICNFAKPAPGQPALLSWDDARTLFHEFGHALHNILSDVTFKSISGTMVARDFVELPSQLYEHWLAVPEVLERFATHAETGAPMPDAMRDRLLAAATYDMGFATVEYTASALVDLGFHDGPAPADPMQKQTEILDEIGMPRTIRMRHATPHFAHVFSGDGYAAGYYSYMWSEVMDADAFAAFEEAGGAFDTNMAARLEETILSIGASRDPEDAYLQFRGRLPGVEALLGGRGLA